MVELNDLQRDALREIGNVGSGNAITALSKFVNIAIMQGLSFMDIVQIESALMFMGGSGEAMGVVYAPAKGDIEGTLLTIFPGSSSYILIDLMKSQPIGTTKAFDEQDKNKIASVGEALTKSYIQTLVDLLGINVSCSGPGKFTNNGSEISKLLSESGYNHAMMLETDFGIPDKGLEGDFIFLLSDASIDKILESVTNMMVKK
jgi:chemotaxis protein CheC